MGESKRYLITASLLDSWRNLLTNEYASREDFLRVLNREPSPTTEAQEKGYAFEKWAEENYETTKGGVYQIKLSQDFISASKTHYLLYGIVDCIKGGVVYDYKHTGNYEVGNFCDKCQSSMYLQLVPSADRIVYIIGKDKPLYQLTENNNVPYNLFEEEYLRDNVRNIGDIISDFEEWLKINNLIEVYHEKWLAK